jgi:hypothetical protein
MTRSDRIDAGPPIVVVGALLLLVSLFLDWYEPGLTAFTVFEVLDLVLAAVALASLVGAAARLGLDLPGGRPLGHHLVVFGLLALVVVVSQVINHPPAAIGEDPETGLWLGLAGAGSMALGGLLSVTRISLAVDVRDSQPGAPRSPEAPASSSGPERGPAGTGPAGAGPGAPGPDPVTGTRPGETETRPLDTPPPGRE